MCMINSCNNFLIDVVVQFYPWLNFYFPLFFFMLIYDNEYKTKEKKIEPRIKLNYNIDLETSPIPYTANSTALFSAATLKNQSME